MLVESHEVHEPESLLRSTLDPDLATRWYGCVISQMVLSGEFFS